MNNLVNKNIYKWLMSNIDVNDLDFCDYKIKNSRSFEMLKKINFDEHTQMLMNTKFKSLDINKLISIIMGEIQNKEITLSINVMTYNEERCIKRCLDSICEIADEIIVIDTGSTDSTKEIISTLPYEVKLYETQWNNDFSLIRNMLIMKSSSDWIFQIDADEFLEKSEDLKTLISIVDFLNFKSPVLSPLLINHDNTRLEKTKRIFKNNGTYSYYGYVHEELRSSIEKMSHIFLDITLKHDGYMANIIESKSKTNRNFSLIQKMTEAEPWNVRWYYFYAREALNSGISFDEVVPILESGLSLDNPIEEYRIYRLGCLVWYCDILIRQKKLKKVYDVIEKMNEEFNDAVDGYYYLSYLKLGNLVNESRKLSNVLVNNIYNINKPISFIHSDMNHIIKVLGDLALNRGDFKEAMMYYKGLRDKNYLNLLKKELETSRKAIDDFLNQIEQIEESTKYE